MKKSDGLIMIRVGALHNSDKKPDTDCILSLVRSVEKPAGDFMVQVIEIDLLY